MDRTTSYLTLQNTIDELIGKIGIAQTNQLLRNFLDKANNTPVKTKELKQVSVFITTQAIKIFDLPGEYFYSSEVREFRDARMSCYYLLKKYTHCTYSSIGLLFNRSNRVVEYGNLKVKDWISVPELNKRFANCHKRLEAKLIEFLCEN